MADSKPIADFSSPFYDSEMADYDIAQLQQLRPPAADDAGGSYSIDDKLEDQNSANKHGEKNLGKGRTKVNLIRNKPTHLVYERRTATADPTRGAAADELGLNDGDNGLGLEDDIAAGGGERNIGYNSGQWEKLEKTGLNDRINLDRLPEGGGSANGVTK